MWRSGLWRLVFRGCVRLLFVRFLFVRFLFVRLLFVRRLWLLFPGSAGTTQLGLCRLTRQVAPTPVVLTKIVVAGLLIEQQVGGGALDSLLPIRYDDGSLGDVEHG